jgi:hypothetical protein
MPRITHQQALDAIDAAIRDAEPLAVAHEIKIIAHNCNGMAEDVKVMVRLDDDKDVVSDALIVGLKQLSMRADNGIVFDGTKMDWGKDGQDFVLLFFSIDMMKSCGG